MKKAIVVFSGGPDSLAAALWAKNQGLEPRLLTFQFKQREQYGELLAASLLAKQLKLHHEIVDFKSPMLSFAPSVHVLMHAGTEAGVDKDKPHRMEFGAGMVLATACAIAVYNGLEDVVWGATKDDAIGGRFEYSQEFSSRFAELVASTTGLPFHVHVPYATKSKHEVLSELKGHEELFSNSWSCKVGERVQCGTCHACVARRVASKASGLNDSTRYHDPKFPLPLSDEEIRSIDSLDEAGRAELFGSDTNPYPWRHRDPT